jgi:hypothetical protein
MEIPSGYDITEEARSLGFDPTDPTLCLRLNKSLYGSPQAGRNWNLDIHRNITSLGFVSFIKDPCIYFRRNQNGFPVIICLYVDDLLICAREDKYLSQLKIALNKKYKLNDMGRVSKFLGIRFKRYSDRLELDLEEYVEKMLSKFGMTRCAVTDNPTVTSVVLSKDQCPSTEEEVKEMSNIPYRELIGSLLFASCTIVPEITAAVSRLAEYMHNPGQMHWHEAKRILRYLKGVKSERFVFLKGESSEKYKLYGYVDADWAANRDNRRSRAGYIFKIGRCIVCWASVLEATVALSSAESELMAATLATKEAIYLRDLLQFLGHAQTTPTTMFEDNSACIRLSINSEFHKRTKHIDMKWFFVRERHNSQEILLKKIRSEDNIADLFTKALSSKQFMLLTSYMYEYYF